MRINEMADTLREVLSTAPGCESIDYLGVAKQKTKRLAAWAAIIAAPTAIAGIYPGPWWSVESRTGHKGNSSGATLRQAE